jgi:hypothetical protein
LGKQEQTRLIRSLCIFRRKYLKLETYLDIHGLYRFRIHRTSGHVVDEAFTAVRASDVVDSDKLFSRLIADGLQK